MLVCKIYGLKTCEWSPCRAATRSGRGALEAGCGRDLRVGPALFPARADWHLRHPEPLIPGHEISGTAAKVGAGVTRVKEGRHGGDQPLHACGTCKACRAGRENLCASMRFLGSASVFPHVQGMFREYFLMGERQCYPITSAVTQASLRSPSRYPWPCTR